MSHAAPVRPQRRAGAHAAPPRQVTSQLSASLPTLEIEDTPQQSGTPVITFDNGTATVNTEICEKLGLDFDTVSKAFAPYCTRVEEITTAESFSDLES